MKQKAWQATANINVYPTAMIFVPIIKVGLGAKDFFVLDYEVTFWDDEDKDFK